MIFFDTSELVMKNYDERSSDKETSKQKPIPPEATQNIRIANQLIGLHINQVITYRTIELLQNKHGNQ